MCILFHLRQRYRVLSVYPIHPTSTLQGSQCLFLLSTSTRQGSQCLSLLSTSTIRSSRCSFLLIFKSRQHYTVLSVYLFSSTLMKPSSQCLSLLIYINDTEFSALQPTYEVLFLFARLYQQNRVLHSLSVCNNHVGFCEVHTGLWALRGSALSFSLSTVRGSVSPFSFMNNAGFCISLLIHQQYRVLHLPSHLSTIRDSAYPFSFINNAGFCISLLTYQRMQVMHLSSHLYQWHVRGSVPMVFPYLDTYTEFCIDLRSS